MFAPDTTTQAALRALLGELAALDANLATELGAALDGVLAAKKPDVTDVLRQVAAAASRHQLPLGRVLTAACCRAFAACVAERYPGRSIELRIPPFAAVQVGFGNGPTHRRGTPPNVVELAPAAFIALSIGAIGWADTPAHTSGAHAHEVAEVFPLT